MYLKKSVSSFVRRWWKFINSVATGSRKKITPVINKAYEEILCNSL